MFELTDAVLTSSSITSFVSLSQSPVFRRKWSSIYAALHDSRPPKRKLLKLMVEQIVTDKQPFLAEDNSFWARPEAKTLKDRTFPVLWGLAIAGEVGVSHVINIYNFN